MLGSDRRLEVLDQDRPAARVGSCVSARVMQMHQGEERPGIGRLLARVLHDEHREPDGLLAKLEAKQSLARRREVSLGEQHVDHPKD